MIQLQNPQQSGLNILCIGAHSDDIEIGSGGTLLKILGKYPISAVYWTVLCTNPIRAEESEKSAEIYLKNVKKKT